MQCNIVAVGLLIGVGTHRGGAVLSVPERCIVQCQMYCVVEWLCCPIPTIAPSLQPYNTQNTFTTLRGHKSFHTKYLRAEKHSLKPIVSLGVMIKIEDKIEH